MKNEVLKGFDGKGACRRLANKQARTLRKSFYCQDLQIFILHVKKRLMQRDTEHAHLRIPPPPEYAWKINCSVVPANSDAAMRDLQARSLLVPQSAAPHRGGVLLRLRLDATERGLLRLRRVRVHPLVSAEGIKWAPCGAHSRLEDAGLAACEPRPSARMTP